MTADMTRSRTHGIGLPPFQPGMRIGLYGGSFNPAHEGHRHVALTALRRLQLDRIWCLVTPGNPLKDIRDLPKLETRITRTAAMMDHPRIDVTGVEAKAGTSYTAMTLKWLQQRTRGVDLVWIMGADNLIQFHHWQQWRSIMASMPVAIVDRPGYSRSPLKATAAKAFAHARIQDNRARALVGAPCPVWTFLYGPRSHLSSTALRRHSQQQSLSQKQQP